MQTSFDFPFLDHYLSSDFLVSAENSTAYNFISNYNLQNQNLPRIFALWGKNSCGKTHLAHIWQRRMAAEFLRIEEIEDCEIANFISSNQCYIVEDVENIQNQIVLFHLFNIIIEKNCCLMLTSNVALNRIEYDFADLASRLKNVFAIEIKDPEIDFIKMLLVKQFAIKQLLVEDKVIDFLAKNIDRNYQRIMEIVRLLEFYCFEEKRKITIPFITEILGKLKSSCHPEG